MKGRPFEILKKGESVKMLGDHLSAKNQIFRKIPRANVARRGGGEDARGRGWWTGCMTTADKLTPCAGELIFSRN